LTATPRDLFLSYENGKDIKNVLNFSKFLFFLVTIAKIYIFKALVPILAIDLKEKKNEKNAIFSHF
jgi:hypothetical protein